jgi:hypothetical protein
MNIHKLRTELVITLGYMKHFSRVILSIQNKLECFSQEAFLAEFNVC